MSSAYPSFSLFSKSLQHKYSRLIEGLASEKEEDSQDVVTQLKAELESVQAANLGPEHERFNSLEILLVAMMGHHHEHVREAAVVLLNVLYDGHDLQLNEALPVAVSTVGESPVVSVPLLADTATNAAESSVVLRLFGSVIQGKKTAVKWTEHPVEVSEDDVLTCKIPAFRRTGFYDWYLNSKENKTRIFDRKRARGRFIVHPERFRESKLIEVPVDEVGAVWEESTGKLQSRGRFDAVHSMLPDLQASGISAVYLMGALERPHDDALNFPFVVADRACPASALGGEEEFSRLVSRISDAGMVTIVDAIDRVSATRAHRKYNGMYVETLSKRDRMVAVAHAGTDCVENEWEETLLFNFRNVCTWDMMISETQKLAKKYKIGGIRLDNAQSAPAILAPDLNELFRRDTDGEYHYSAEDRVFGKFVKSNVESGYWSTDSALYCGYPNPFLMKFARRMWEVDPNFVLIAESHFLRESQLILSGFIPHTARIPQILASMNGKSLRRNGTMAKLSCYKKSTPATLARLLKHDRIALPKRPIMINCTCTHLSPYPGALYGRLTWLAIDLLFLLPDVPILLHGEKSGKTHRINMAPISEQEDSFYDLDYNEVLPRSPKRRAPVSPLDGLSSLSLRPNGNSKPLPPFTKSSVSSNEAEMLNGHISSEEEKPLRRSGHKRSKSFLGMKRGRKPSLVRSQSREDMQEMSVRSVSAAELRKIDDLAEQTRMEIDPSSGFDLLQIRTHYQHRELIRQENDILRQGEFCVLSPDPQAKDHVFAFARLSNTGLIVIAANFRDHRDGFGGGFDVELDLEILWDRLSPTLIKKYNSLFLFENILSDDKEAVTEICTLEELMFQRLHVHVRPLSLCMLKLVEVEDGDSEEKRTEHFAHCLTRLQGSDASNIIMDARQNYIISSIARGASKSFDDFTSAINRARAGLLADGCSNEDMLPILKLCLQRASSLRSLVLYDEKSAPYDFNPPPSERILSYLALLTTASKDEDLRTLTRQLVSSSPNIGPLVFLTAELGRFSTAGGLGVMVDELTKGLAKLGLDIYVVSPYYAVNRKNQTDYLGKHITWKRNLLIDVNPCLEVGVFEGVEDSVNLIFLERKDYFTKVYADPGHTTRHVQCVCLLSLGSLEVFCQKKIKPAMVVTNDWLPALASAYARTGRFGTFYDDTSFFHIIHNLGNIEYEGRVFPHREGDTLTYIHRLPVHLLVDPWWARVMINPTRAALLTSDSWGTVSQSYLKELQASHPLAPLLRMAKSPFGFPNGIPIAERKAILLSQGAKTHAEAKQLLQKKYFSSTGPDASIPLLSFVGRITMQKGVSLILETVEEIIAHTGGRVQILCGGPANYDDPYSAECAYRMKEYRYRYPASFWANPDEFFTDGPLVNLGSDFGLMPSLFEPGGIVQQEFFVCGTPVIANKTGGLKDTVHEWNSEEGEGNGFLLDAFSKEAILAAVKKALRVFSDSNEYEELRNCASQTTIDVSQVAWAWCSEFHRLRNAIYSRSDLVQKDYTKCLEHRDTLKSPALENGSVVKHIDWVGVPPPSGEVSVMGSWDGWSRKWVLRRDGNDGVLRVQLLVRPGKYFYKYLVEGEWKLLDKKVENDERGFENHTLYVEA